MFSELKKKIPDLRTLNTLHSEKLLAYKMEPRNGQNGNAEAPPGICNYANLFPEQWSQFAIMAAHQTRIDDDRSISSPGQASQHGGSDWSGSDSKDDHDAPYGSPRSVSSSGVSTDESATAKSPLRTLSSAKNNCTNNDEHTHDPGNFSPARQMAQFHIGRRPSRTISSTAVCPVVEVNGHDQGVISGDETFYGDQNPVKASSVNNYTKIRRVDSPTDSGIESGKEHANGSTPTTSVCSSPRSAMDDKVKEVSDSENSEKQESIDDMPMLKRALQAPPLINTNMLMDEAYRHHKKFRAAARKEGEPHSPSTTTSSADTLASSHSTLLKTLEQPSRYMNEQQLKRTDLIHNIIMRTEAVSTTSQSNWRSPKSEHNGPVQNGFSYHNGTHQNGNSVQTSHALATPAYHGNKGMGCSPGYYIPSNYQQQASCPYSSSQQSRPGKLSLSPTPVAAPASRIFKTPVDSHHNSYVQQLRRSPCSPISSPSVLVIGSTPPPQQSTTPHLSRSCASSPHSANMLMSQSDASDSQPLNLSKKASAPNSPTDISIKIES